MAGKLGLGAVFLSAFAHEIRNWTRELKCDDDFVPFFLVKK